MNWNLSSLPLETRQTINKIFREDFDLKIMHAMKEQVAMKARDEAEHNRRSMDGLGERKFQIHTFIDTLWRHVYGHNYSHDADLMKFLAKRNPEITTRSHGTKLMVGYMPGGSSRFRKVYPSNEK